MILFLNQIAEPKSAPDEVETQQAETHSTK